MTSERTNAASELDSFNVRAAWRRSWFAVRRHPLIIGVTSLLAVVLVSIYVAIWPPVYVGELAFLVEREVDTSRDAFYLEWNMFRKDDIESETSMMLASSILEETARDLDLTYDDVYHTFMSWSLHLWRESAAGKKYREIKEQLFPPEVSEWAPTPEQIEMAKIISDFHKGVSTRRIGQSYVGLLSVKASSPRAPQIANRIFEIYQRQRLERHQREADLAHETLDLQATDAERELVAFEELLVTFSKKNGLLLDFEREKIEVQQWLDLEATLKDMGASIAGSEARLIEMDAFLAGELPSVTGSSTFVRNRMVEELESELSRYETELVGVQNDYLPGSPEIVKLERKIEDLRERLASTEATVASSRTEILNSTFEGVRSQRGQVASELAGLRASLEHKEQAASVMQARLNELPVLRQEYTLLVRDIASMQIRYGELRTRATQADVARKTIAETMPSLRLLESARPVDRPVWPRTKMLLAGAAVLGLLFGAGAAILRDLFLDPVSLDDVARGRGDAVFLAEIHTGHGRGFDIPRRPLVDGPAPRRTPRRRATDDETLFPHDSSRS